VPRRLQGGAYETRTGIATLSNARDGGNPRNWDRIMELFDHDVEALKTHLTAYSYTDEQTAEAIDKVFWESKYVVCPHTAIAWMAGQRYKNEHPDDYAIVSLSTAHACKFPAVFSKEIGKSIQVPESVNELKDRQQ